MKTQLLAQPFSGSLGKYLKTTLSSSQFTNFKFAVAFAKNSGVLRLEKTIKEFRKRNGTIDAYVGVDLDGTSYEALSSLFQIVDNLFVVHVESDQTFHTKLFCLNSDKQISLVVGSHNLTGGGLWRNIETSIVLESQNQKEFSDLLSQANSYFTQLKRDQNVCKFISSQDEIDVLLRDGYISSEAKQLIRKSKQRKSSKTNTLFAKSIPAALPGLGSSMLGNLSTSKTAGGKSISGPISVGSSIMWFETKRLTGGSRNILDLSRDAVLLGGYAVNTATSGTRGSVIQGGVQFFGINPDEKPEDKNITINFKGKDYFGNTIKFPKSDKANGTWRLLIKGVAEDHTKITALRDLTLVNKVLVFEKIDQGYYAMSIFPRSELKRFMAASKLYASNGKRLSTTARKVGLL